MSSHRTTIEDVAKTSAVRNRSETSMTFGGYTMRFTPMGGLLRVLVSR